MPQNFFAGYSAASPAPGTLLDANFTELFNYVLGVTAHAAPIGFGTTNTDPTYNRVTGAMIKPSGVIVSRATGASDFGLAASSGTHFAFYTDNGSARVSAGSISSSGSTTTFATSSDYRLKHSIADLTGSGAFIDALQPREWVWADGGGRGAGFVAHEFAAVSPGSVVGAKDAVDAQGRPVYQALQAGSSEVIANLVAEVQALRQRVAALEVA